MALQAVSKVCDQQRYHFFPFPPSKLRSKDQSESQALDLGFSGDFLCGDNAPALVDLDGEVARPLACSVN